MTGKKPTELNDEELIRKEKKMRGLAFGFMIVWIILLVTVICLTVKKGFTPLIATPLGLSPVLMVVLNSWNELKKEIKLRKL